jgi:DNA-binding MarR family transcriptional regulator
MIDDPELRRVVRELNRIVATPIIHESSPKIRGYNVEEERDPDALSRLAHRLYRLRNARSTIISEEFFGEPAWDILLDLYVQRRRGVRVSVTSACIASNSPPTTALRWIEVLEEGSYVKREQDPKDKRRHFVSLTEIGEQKIKKVLSNMFTSLREFYAN